MKSEKEVREGLMNHAHRIGAQDDLQHLFDKWDRAIALAPSSEKKEMSRAAILAIQALLDIHAEDGLTINDEVVIPTTSGEEK
jgi:hypothetical protein